MKRSRYAIRTGTRYIVVRNAVPPCSDMCAPKCAPLTLNNTHAETMSPWSTLQRLGATALLVAARPAIVARRYFRRIAFAFLPLGCCPSCAARSAAWAIVPLAHPIVRCCCRFWLLLSYAPSCAVADAVASRCRASPPSSRALRSAAPSTPVCTPRRFCSLSFCPPLVRFRCQLHRTALLFVRSFVCRPSVASCGAAFVRSFVC